jgi:hypothetical protein
VLIPIKALWRHADKDPVGRSIGLISFLLAAAIVAFLWAKSAQQNGPTSPAAQQAEQQALQEASSINFQQAVPTVEAWFAENGTYAGVTLPPSYGVAVMRADGSSYCLQGTIAGRVEHLTGPGGSAVVDGPCS